MRFIVYSDIHHDKFSSKCLTIEDTIKIENDIHAYARSINADFVLFAGDRFFLRDPTDEVKTKADWALIGNMYNAKYKQYHLIGNHDWLNKSMNWHTSESLRGCPNIVLMDDTKSHIIDGTNAIIHALPSGLKFDINKYSIDKNLFNIFTFHDLVVGCFLDEKGKYTSPSGLKLGDIDRQEFDFVIAGDNHIPQQFAFQFTKGGYVGSTNQRTKADAGSNRGFLDIEVTNNGGYQMSTNFILVRPFFEKIKLEVNENSDFHQVSELVEGKEDILIEVELIGKKEVVDRIANDPKWQNLETWGTIRGLDIVRTYNVENNEVVVDMSKSHSIKDDLDIYINSGFVDLGIIKKDQLVSKLQSYQEVIK